MAGAANLDECVERLLRDFATYDRAVDVVSAFEMVYTTSRTELPATVRHFERFPRVAGDTGNTLTPDFSVVFNDGGGLVGEIARVALHKGSVDSLCSQIARYDTLRQLPTAGGSAEVSHADVLLLVPQSVGVAAVKRVVVERFANPDHPYKPSAAPCVVQFAFDEGRYIFQRLLEPGNGMPRDDDRPDGLSHWFDQSGGINVRPSRFSDIKAERAFMNDPVDPLYLATHLWAKTFPTIAVAPARPARIEIRSDDLATELRSKHGGVLASDVDRALELLRTAKLAERSGDHWIVAWEELRVPREGDLAHALAHRACRPPTRGALARLEAAEEAVTTRPSPPPTLF